MDPTEHEPLMAAIGRIAVRAAELGDHIDYCVSLLRPGTPKWKSARLMLGAKLEAAMEAANEGTLARNPGLKAAFVELCNACLGLLPDRNSPVHSTYIVDDDGIVKWDNREGPEVVTVDGLNATATQFAGAASNALSLGLDIRDFINSGIVSARYLA
jgi:hypothetical protein